MPSEGSAIEPDETRWSRIEAGDYAYLVRRFWKPIHRFLLSRVGNRDEAEELTQELFLSFLEKGLLSRVEVGKGSLRTFLFHVSRQFLIDWYRAAGAQKRGSGRIRRLEPFDEDALLESRGPEEEFEREFYLSLFNRARRSLKRSLVEHGKEPVYRAFRLFFFGNQAGVRLPHKEIADQLSLTMGQVRNHIHRAKKAFLERIDREIASYARDEAEHRSEQAAMVRFLERTLGRKLSDTAPSLAEEPPRPE